MQDGWSRAPDHRHLWLPRGGGGWAGLNLPQAALALAVAVRRWLQPLACISALVLLLAATPARAAQDVAAVPGRYSCDGMPLTATLHAGAVDDPTIPNASAGTLPGAFVQLRWQRADGPLALQLPRTNNAGAPSFTDGKWWWSLEDPLHPAFRLRRGVGDVQDFVCNPA